MRLRRPFKEFCACGAGITLVGFDDQADLQVLDVWRDVHSGAGHERVSAGEARDIRHAHPRRAR